MGDDREPARAARISYSDGVERTFEQDMKLTRYLLEHGHMSPFEMVEVKFHIKAPIFVARQLMTHRTFNRNEFSMRYADPERISEDGIDFYTPEEFRLQDTVNKQGSKGVLEGEDNFSAFVEYNTALAEAETSYREMVKLGVAKEQARMVLPVSVYTEWIWKNDLRNTWNMLRQRLDTHAQQETRQYAMAMEDLLRAELPHLMELARTRGYA